MKDDLNLVFTFMPSVMDPKFINESSTDSLFLINETFTNGYISNTLDILCILAILSGIFVIISKNPIISVLFLIGLFASISSYLIMLGLSFIGLAYLIVYIGAVSILFLFILMLINIRISELQSNTSNSIPLAIIIAISFNYSIFQLLPYDIAILSNFNSYINTIIYNINLNKSIFAYYPTDQESHYNFFEKININNSDVLFVTSKTWDGTLMEFSDISSIGSIMYTNYSVWLILSSFILLLAMVGSIIITIRSHNSRGNSN